MSLSTTKRALSEHFVFWLFIYFFVFDYYLENNWWEAIFRTFLEIGTYMCIVYLHLLVLIPFLAQKKYVFYLLGILSTIIAYIGLLHWTGFELLFYEHTGWRNIFSMVLNISLFLLISLLYWYFKERQLERERYFLLENEKLATELNFLRSQISPHFLFNSLNNIYSLAIQEHPNTAPMVAKLSIILRYILYEGAQNRVPLSREIQILREFCDMQLLKKPLSENVDFYIEGRFDDWKIAPTLLMTFIENAFKHSHLENDATAWIRIHIEINQLGEFYFCLENSLPAAPQSTEKGGIGLQNVERQVALNYPNAKLIIEKHIEYFSVNLNITLSK